MIGQKNLQNRIEQLIENDTFPRFSTFVGPKGSGKKTFANEIAKKIKNAIVFDVGLSVGDVRAAVENSYKMVNTVVRIIPDADTMSSAAKNALLKVTEEPPNNAYWIMTLEDENNTLETIRSRATIFHMDRYTLNELMEYCADMYFNGDDDSYYAKEQIVTKICETPGEVDTLWKCNPLEFYNYVQLVADNIVDVQLANAFKIPSKVALKDTDEGYDLKLFWKTFMYVCVNKNGAYTFQWINVTSKYLQKLKVKGINRQMLMDNWILEVREAWQN